jgi:glycosyltransferase involved in cell wall biosynthesis
MKIEIIIPTMNRSKELETALQSLTNQTRNPDIVTICDGGSIDSTHAVASNFSRVLNIKWLQTTPGLVHQMNFALSQSDSDVIIRTDDDVIFTPGYIEGVFDALKDVDVLGVTGPTIIPQKFQANRDLMRLIFSPGFFNYLRRRLYDFLCDGRMLDIGYFSSYGVFSVGTNLPDSANHKIKDVSYLEACNFAVRRTCLMQAGGFSTGFGDIGEYHEPDTCFIIKRNFSSGKFIFHPQVALYHCPSLKGFFSDRSKISPRIRNYCEFIVRNRGDALKHVKKYRATLYLVLIIFFFASRVRSLVQLKDLYMSLKNISILNRTI